LDLKVNFFVSFPVGFRSVSILEIEAGNFLTNSMLPDACSPLKGMLMFHVCMVW